MTIWMMSFLGPKMERHLSRRISSRRSIDPREFSEDLCLRRSRRARVRVPSEAVDHPRKLQIFSLPGDCKFSLSPFFGEIDKNPRLDATIYFYPIFAESINTPRLRTSEWLGRKRGPLADAFSRKSGRQRSPWLVGFLFLQNKREREKICSKGRERKFAVMIIYDECIQCIQPLEAYTKWNKNRTARNAKTAVTATSGC
jgi:hypothetical protein